MPLINTKLHTALSWTKNCIMSEVGNDNDNDANANTFQLIKTELCIPAVTLNTSDNKKLSEFLKTIFKRSVFWSEYNSKIETQAEDNKNLKRILFDS